VADPADFPPTSSSGAGALMKRPSEIDPVAAKQAIMIAEFLTRLGSIRASPKLIPEEGSAPGFDIALERL
jgi:hypothetical protein